MSRIGKLAIDIPDNVELTFEKNTINFFFEGLKASYKISQEVTIEVLKRKIRLSRAKDSLPSKYSMYAGMDRSNIKNILIGLHKGFQSTIEIIGVGYKVLVENGFLLFTLGYSHEIFYVLPVGVTASFEKPNLIIISGKDKVLVGQTSAEIISFRKTEPYKGKGIKIFGKKTIKKEGKKK